MNVEVADIRIMVGDGKCKAIADVRFDDDLVIRGFTVFEGRNGIFVALPRKAGISGRWYDVIELSEELKVAVEDAVLKAYDEERPGTQRPQRKGWSTFDWLA